MADQVMQQTDANDSKRKQVNNLVPQVTVANTSAGHGIIAPLSLAQNLVAQPEAENEEENFLKRKEKIKQLTQKAGNLYIKKALGAGIMLLGAIIFGSGVVLFIFDESTTGSACKEAWTDWSLCDDTGQQKRYRCNSHEFRICECPEECENDLKPIPPILKCAYANETPPRLFEDVAKGALFTTQKQKLSEFVKCDNVIL